MVIPFGTKLAAMRVLDTRSNYRLSSSSRRLETRLLGLGATGLSRAIPIARVWYSLLGQAAIWD